MPKKRAYRTHQQKAVPKSGILIEEREQVTIYRWHNNPIELWKWDLRPGRAPRIDLRGLEKLPSTKQFEAPLAFLADLREQDKRNKGDLGGPGRPREREYDEPFQLWINGGFKKEVLQELKEEYMRNNQDVHAEERFLRSMRRRKKEWSKKD